MIFELLCYILPLVGMGLAYWWEQRPVQKRARNRQLIERGYGFLVDREEYNEVLEEEVLIQKSLQEPKLAKKRDDFQDTER